MKTGLLSLNIHDSLTFEGSELCLHPDLFSVPGDVASNSQQTGISRKAEDGKSSGATANSGNTTSASTAVGLAVGDMIEIRVWDPLPKEQAILKSPGASPSVVFRKNKFSPTGATAPAAKIEVEFPTPSTDSLTTTQPSTSSSAPAAAATGMLNDNTSTLRPRADSLVYSVCDPTQDGEMNESSKQLVPHNEETKDQASVTTESAKSSNSTEVASTTMSAPSITPLGIGGGDDDGESVETPPTRTVSTLPPVFPRPRASTTDLPSTTPTLKGGTNPASSLPKPPLVHRRVTSGSAGLSPKFTRGHARNISDMTMDTQHLDIIEAGYYHVDSQDDDDGYSGMDVWAKVNTTHKLRLSFVFLVTDKTMSSLKGTTRTQISMLRQVADLYSLSSYDMVTVHKIDPHDHHEVLKAVSADFVVMTIKDQFISRGDMHLFQRELEGSWIYEGQRLTETARQIKAHALEIRHGNDAAKSGIITDKTMITFRSRSARIIWLVQLSSEMWDYASPYDQKGEPHSVCEVYFDKWVRFLYKLFAKWKALEVTHSLTIVFFSRTFLGNGQTSPLECKDVYGRSYEDHYKPVVENETRTEWESLIARIKEEFVKYPLEVGWNSTDRRPSSASQGNVLEAVNVTLNIMQYHFLDRDLYRTGNSIVVVSPGCGVFEVDKELAGITYQRMMDNGIGSDMLSLGLPPLHIAPFFLYNNEFRNVETQGVDTTETYFEVPHWMHLSFISYDREEHQLGDHIHQEDFISPTVKKKGRLDAFELGPNGFLKPNGGGNGSNHFGAPTLDPKSPSSFSALGNRAATPGKAKAHQERKLISGRPFRDILEACRPRLSGMKLPSALDSLLKKVEFEQTIHDEGATKSSALQIRGNNKPNSPAPLTEWGTVHFDDLPFKSTRPKAHMRAIESMVSRQLPGGVSNDKTEDSDNASNASSFMSHVSSVFGMSYDRLIWDHVDSPLPPRSTFKIQRSLSMELDKLAQPISEDDLTSACTAENGSGSGVLGRVNAGSDIDAVGRPVKHAEKLLAMMAAHDENVWVPANAKRTPLGEMSAVRPESLQHVDSDITLSSKNSNQNAPGGLGAALSQYSGPSPLDMPNSTRLTRRASGGFLLGQARNPSGADRMRSQSPIFPTMTQLPERAIRGMSPMLLPTAHSTTLRQASDEPPTKLLSERSTGFLADNSRFLSTHAVAQGNRDTLGGSVVLHGSGSYQNTSQRPLPFGEGKRHLIRPIARSPPSGFRHNSRGTPGGANHTTGTSPTSGGLLRQSSTRTKDMQRKSPTRQGLRPISPLNRTGAPGRTRRREQNKYSMRQQKACNPFRQSDEDEVLAKRSHNRRRWSHVFPAGEIEFKRHSGPIYNSLCAPAILPLSVDYFPSPQELLDVGTFQFNPYTVTLGGIENKHYNTHAELLLEMVRQRVAQDFQIVTETAVKASEARIEPQRIVVRSKAGRALPGRDEAFVPSLPTIKHEATGTIKHYLSMGHRIQVLSYDPSADTIEIVAYNRKSAQNDPNNVYTYRFMVYSRFEEGYAQSIQTFKKYADPYKWNKVDNLICGEEDRQLETGMRFRRVMYGMVPESFSDIESEKDYVARFQRLLEYLGKLRGKNAEKIPLDIKITTSEDSMQDTEDVFQVRRPSEDSMIKLTVPLRRGKQDPFEWMEIALGATFDTNSSYRIMFNWLVASSAKVETQVQLFQRRCSQFGLRIINFPQTTISRDLFLHSFAVPTILTLRSKDASDLMDEELRKMDFIYDGTRFTNGQVLDRIDHKEEFDFPKYRNGKVRGIPSWQYVHRSGTLFIRNIRDRQGWSILVGIENHRQTTHDKKMMDTALDLLRNVADVVKALSPDRKVP